jgi:hypothetical protein
MEIIKIIKLQFRLSVSPPRFAVATALVRRKMPAHV